MVFDTYSQAQLARLTLGRGAGRHDCEECGGDETRGKESP